MHGDEQQAGAGGGGAALGKHGGEDGQTGHDSGDGVRRGDDPGVDGDVGVLLQIGAVGDHGSHAQRAGEQHLARGSAAGLEEVELRARHLHALGGEHIHQPLLRAGQSEVVYDQEDQNGEQGGDAHLIELFNA